MSNEENFNTMRTHFDFYVTKSNDKASFHSYKQIFLGIILQSFLQRICKIEYYRRILQAKEMSLRHANFFVSQNNRNNKDSMHGKRERRH